MTDRRIILRAATGAVTLMCAATLLYSGAVAGPKCTAQSTIASNFNGTPISGGNFIWFNANFSAKGIPATGAKIFFQNSTIQFTADQTYSLNVPSAQVTFDPTASCATVSFDPWANRFNAIVPVSGCDEIFLTGLAFPVPDSFAAAGGRVNGPWSGRLCLV